MEQHPRRDDEVELTVRERQLLRIADACVHASRAGKLDHPLRDVDRDDLDAELRLHPLADLAWTGPDLEHAPRSGRDDLVPHDVSRIRADPVVVERAARLEPGFGGVLAADDVRVVQVAHSSICRPGSFRPGVLPPSHAFTVAPTSANSPSSCTRPAAFRPAA